MYGWSWSACIWCTRTFVELARVRVERVDERSRLAVRERDDDVGALGDVVEDGFGRRRGDGRGDATFCQPVGSPRAGLRLPADPGQLATGRSASAIGSSTLGVCGTGRYTIADVGAGLGERGRGVGQRARPGRRVVAQVHRVLDRRRVAADLRAPLLERRLDRGPVVDAGGRVPLLREAGDRAQRAGRSVAADRRSAGAAAAPASARSARRGAARSGRRGRSSPARATSTIASTPSSNRSKRSFSGGSVMPYASHSCWFQPAPTPEVEPAAGDDVDGRGHVREHGRVAVDHARHLTADADAARRLRHRREHRPRLQARSVGVGEDRIEVVEVPRRLEQRRCRRRPATRRASPARSCAAVRS